MTGSELSDLELSSPVERLALAYAPAHGRAIWHGLLALDARLARTARPAKEPVLAQIKLAWWRDRFAGPVTSWPAGEPLLTLLIPWEDEREALSRLVDGWEAREIGEDGGIALRAARVEAVLALARLAGAGDHPDAVRRAALDWQDGQAGGASPRLSRTMRPLAVLRGLALRESAGAGPLRTFAAAVRIGLTGR